jgi:hypothetical protein
MPLPDPLPPDGFSVLLRATFSGIKGVPVLSVASNNLTALFVLHDDRVTYRVMRKTERPYADIERIEASRSLKQIEIIWRDRWLTFTAGLRKEDDLLDVLRFFRDKDLPLSPSAQALVDGL